MTRLLLPLLVVLPLPAFAQEPAPAAAPAGVSGTVAGAQAVTDWLKDAGGYGMAVVVLALAYFACKYLIGQIEKRDAVIVAKDAAIKELNDKQLDLLGKINLALSAKKGDA